MSGSGNGGRPSRMILERFRVRGFRCIQDAELVLEPGVTVLVGRNDVGKTALLDALSDYGEVGRLGVRHASHDTELSGGDTPAAFEATWRAAVSGDASKHRLSCDPERPSEVLDTPSGHYEWDPRKRQIVVDGKSYDARGVKRSSYLSAISLEEWRNETDVPDEVARALAHVGQLRTPTPYLLQPTALATPTSLELATADFSGFGWSALLQELIARRDQRIDYLEERMKGLFPFFRRVRAVEERWEVTRQVSGVEDPGTTGRRAASSGPEFLRHLAESSSQRMVEFEIEVLPPGQLAPTTRWIPAQAESSGVLLALAYLTVAAHAEPGSLLALEEPENGLNETIALRMMRAFLELIHEQEHQLIMTTHNPYWLDLVDPRAVRVVTRDEAGTHVHRDPENLQRILDEDLRLSEVMGLGGPEELLRKRGGDE